MADQKTDRMSENVRTDVPAERQPWSKPTLTVRSIEEVTRGTRASVNTDATQQFDNS